MWYKKEDIQNKEIFKKIVEIKDLQNETKKHQNDIFGIKWPRELRNIGERKMKFRQ